MGGSVLTCAQEVPVLVAEIERWRECEGRRRYQLLATASPVAEERAGRGGGVRARRTHVTRILQDTYAKHAELEARVQKHSNTIHRARTDGYRSCNLYNDIYRVARGADTSSSLHLTQSTMTPPIRRIRRNTTQCRPRRARRTRRCGGAPLRDRLRARRKSQPAALSC